MPSDSGQPGKPETDRLGTIASASRIGRLPPAAWVAIVLAIICGISLYIRIALSYDQVFVDGTVLFRGVDPWYHMRLIENLVHHFPHRIAFDPYTFYPTGYTVGFPPFFDWLVAGAALIVGWGSPSQHTLDAVGAYAPAILGTLIVIPVYFIGKELFSRWVGLLSAALVAILPGELLNRSLLGFTDHHVAETLFATTTILFFLLAIRRAREREIAFGHLRSRDWAVITKPLIYSLLAGVFLGIYLLTWIGALLVVFIIFAYLVIQFLIDHLRHRSTDYLCIIAVPAFLLSLIMALPYLTSRGAVYLVPMLVAILVPMALSAISRLMARRAIRPAYYPLVLAGLAGAGFAVFYAIDPTLIQTMLSKFGIFAPAGAKLTIIEAQPLLRPFGTGFSLNIAWANFTTCFFISFISLVWLIYGTAKKESADRTLFLVWSVIMLLAVLAQRRFSYYFAVNAALLTGYFCWRVLDFAALRELLATPREAVKVVKRVKKKKRKVKAAQKTVMRPRASWIKLIIAGVAIFFLVFFPNIGPAKALAQSSPLITEAWYSSTAWLKENSPEPFADPDFYYELYETPFQYPETAYGVVSWWDYGHWITRIGRRIPNSSPAGQRNAPEVASFFIAQDESSASQIMDDKLRSKYVMIDNEMITGKFYAMPQWAGHSQDEFFEIYYVQTEGGKLEAVNLFYPPYYRSMVVRLYNFDGQAVVPKETLVITFEERLSSEGVPYKEITNSWTFPTYEEAQNYIASQESENYRIVSQDPLASPVPLEELSHYELVHGSAATANVAGKQLPKVKIFEYVQSTGP
jgi:oligosaccharyl transferase (archaeosortase A-associated)